MENQQRGYLAVVVRLGALPSVRRRQFCATESEMLAVIEGWRRESWAGAVPEVAVHLADVPDSVGNREVLERFVQIMRKRFGPEWRKRSV